MNATDNITSVKTKDSEEAAFLWTRDDAFVFSDIEAIPNHDGKNTVWFCFTSEKTMDEVSKIRTEYRMGKTLVEPRKYASRRNEVRSIILEKRKNG